MQEVQNRFHVRDIAEIVIGSAILTFPVAMTEDAWNLGEDLPVLNTIIIIILSVSFVAWYAYHAHYQSSLDTHGKEWLLRIVVTYTVTLFVAAMILAVFNKFPFWSEPAV